MLLAVVAWGAATVCGGETKLDPPVARRAVGALQVGAARAELKPPWPIVVAGYPPPRPSASSQVGPLFARVLALEVGELRLGLVTVDLLTVPESLARAVATRAKAHGYDDVWLLATHAHSSFGGYDDTLFAQVAGTGRHRAEVTELVVSAADTALADAARGLQPAELWWGRAEASPLSAPRSGDAVDAAVQRLVFRGEAGELAELIALSAHPTLAGRHPPGLDPDYPGAPVLAGAAPRVTLVVQGAAGNASATQVEEGPRGYAARVRAFVDSMSLARVEGDLVLSMARQEAALPSPDPSRLVPSFLRWPSQKLLCAWAPRRASVSYLSLGPAAFVLIPGEPTYDAGQVLSRAAGGARVLGLASGYLGYVEGAERVRGNTGEAKRQYYGPELLEVLAGAAQRAHQSFTH